MAGRGSLSGVGAPAGQHGGHKLGFVPIDLVALLVDAFHQELHLAALICQGRFQLVVEQPQLTGQRP